MSWWVKKKKNWIKSGSKRGLENVSATKRRELTFLNSSYRGLVYFCRARRAEGTFSCPGGPRKFAASLSAEERAGGRWKVSPRSFPESTFLCSGLTSAGPKPPETRGNEPHRGAQTPSVLFQAHWTALALKKKKLVTVLLIISRLCLQ